MEREEVLTIRVNCGNDDLSKFIQKRELEPQSESYILTVKAEALRLANLHKDAVEKYLQVVMLDRTNVEAYLGAAYCYKHLEKFDKAIKILESAKDFCEENFNVYLELGLCYMNTGEICKAMPNLMSAIKLDRTNLNAQIQLAHAHEFCEETDLALMIYQKIIEQNSAYIRAYEHKANLLMSLGRFKEASKVLYDVIKINPDFYRAYMGIALCFDKMNRYADAIRYYRMYLSRKPNSKDKDDILERLKDLKEKVGSSKSSNVELKIV